MQSLSEGGCTATELIEHLPRGRVYTGTTFRVGITTARNVIRVGEALRVETVECLHEIVPQCLGIAQEAMMVFE